ncbi:MAG: pyruvate formate-lyase activating enzyme [Erysipelotrichaceae bacterium]|nr:MAG: pyruvate formate-lyase activating [Erysipelotrichaceae bacterium]TXT16311.1 MAG: pyruvate formate-lyase activating enzyme [Erysipelotrichaceae bacterium]
MNPSRLGYISKIEPFGTFDGPGIRSIIFLSGCPLRCVYCHNPETWQAQIGNRLSAQEITELALRNKPYYGQHGGVTFSGGEPLNQPEFLLECLLALKAAGIHTALDTSGFSLSPLLPEIIKATDLIIYDLKAAQEDLYKKITSQKMDVTEKFLELAQSIGTPLWIRQVMVPGLNDNQVNLLATAQRIAKLKYVDKIEILPYHTLGKSKYELMEIEYPLGDTPAMSLTKGLQWQAQLIDLIENIKSSK